MKNKEILERLKNDDDYYGQFGRKFMSNSDIYNLLKNPTQFRVPQDKTKAMLEGSYFHTKMLEPQKIESFSISFVEQQNGGLLFLGWDDTIASIASEQVTI